MNSFRTLRLPNNFLHDEIAAAFRILNNAGIETSLNEDMVCLNFDIVDMKYLETQKSLANKLLLTVISELLKIRSFSSANGKVVFKSFN